MDSALAVPYQNSSGPICRSPPTTLYPVSSTSASCRDSEDASLLLQASITPAHHTAGGSGWMLTFTGQLLSTCVQASALPTASPAAASRLPAAAARCSRLMCVASTFRFLHVFVQNGHCKRAPAITPTITHKSPHQLPHRLLLPSGRLAALGALQVPRGVADFARSRSGHPEAG